MGCYKNPNSFVVCLEDIFVYSTIKMQTLSHFVSEIDKQKRCVVQLIAEEEKEKKKFTKLCCSLPLSAVIKHVICTKK